MPTLRLTIKEKTPDDYWFYEMEKEKIDFKVMIDLTLSPTKWAKFAPLSSIIL